MVRALGIERLRKGQAQRAEGRCPEERQSGGIAQARKIEALREDVAATDNPGEAQRRVRARAGPRKQELAAAGRVAVAADDIAVQVLRAERERAVAAYRAGAAGKEVLEERQRLAPQAARHPDVGACKEGESPRQRVVPLVLIAEPDVLEVAARDFGRCAHERGRTRGDQAVARVARPASGSGSVAIVVAELLHEIEVAERTVVEGLQLHGLEVEAEVDAAHLRHRITELDAAAERVRAVGPD